MLSAEKAEYVLRRAGLTRRGRFITVIWLAQDRSTTVTLLPQHLSLRQTDESTTEQYVEQTCVLLRILRLRHNEIFVFVNYHIKTLDAYKEVRMSTSFAKLIIIY